MQVGIYMPQYLERTRKTPPRDYLEQEFFRRALSSVRDKMGDIRFIWFSKEGDHFPCEAIPTVPVRSGISFLSAGSNGCRTLTQALREYQVDLLMTRIDAPLTRISLPKVLFTLDMTFHSATSPAAPMPKYIKRNCTEARSILCPSVYVHKTCSSQLEIGLEKAVVARAGVDDIFGNPTHAIVEGPYALFILNRYTHAHIPTFIESIRRNVDLFPPHLVVLGPLHDHEPESWGRPVIRIERCPDAMTAALLQHAEITFYLAKGDGCGMPALQALRAGARLITSKSGAIFELAGTAPFYCEADNVLSLLQILRRMRDETPDEQEKRRQMSRSLVMDCTWERCGKKLLSALKRSLL